MPDIGRFAPPVAWMAVIAVVSGDLFASDETGPWLLPWLAALLPGAGPDVLEGVHVVLRKLGHLVEYGILGALWLRALAPVRPARRAALWAVGLAVLYAAADEARQGLTAHRSPAALDVLIDAAGASLAVAWLEAPRGLGVPAVRLGRWAALIVAAGSLAAAGVDWRLGLPAWDLLVAALGAALVAWGLRGLERRWRDAA